MLRLVAGHRRIELSILHYFLRQYKYKYFADPFEGAMGVESRKEKWDEFYLSFLEKQFLQPPEWICPLLH